MLILFVIDRNVLLRRVLPSISKIGSYWDVKKCPQLGFQGFLNSRPVILLFGVPNENVRYTE